MFTINSRARVYNNPSCAHGVSAFKIASQPADYFDKDGFELTALEREFYRVNNFPLDTTILNHSCMQQSWIELQGDSNIFLDHCIILHRCDFVEAAKEQLLSYKHRYPKISYLLQCKQKWGLDLALDYFDGENMYEVIHIEQDFFTSEECTAYKENIEKFVLATDWEDAAKRLILKKDEWYSLIGFAQNDWKAKFFGFPKAELTHKALMYDH